MGCDVDGKLYSRDDFVSIHAPAWGATRILDKGYDGYDVSIHAPAWGATWNGGDANPRGRRFNPRTRMGCDYDIIGKTDNVICFNPRTRMGCDSRNRGGAYGQGRFNPRTRMGCD